MKQLWLALLVCFTLPAQAQTPADEARMRWQAAINTLRLDRLLALAPKVMPNCQIDASPQDVDQFYVYWRRIVSDDIAMHKALGWSLDQGDSDGDKPALPTGRRIMKNMSYAELLHVGPQVRGSTEIAHKQIRIWQALHCVVERFGGDKYFAWYGNAGQDGMQWPLDPILTLEPDLVPIDPNKTTMLLTPNMMNLEPIEALGHFFREAQAKGLLAFSGSNEERYFFERYESDYFADMRDAKKASAWFHTPPWAPDAPRLDTPMRPSTIQSPKSQGAASAMH